MMMFSIQFILPLLLFPSLPLRLQSAWVQKPETSTYSSQNTSGYASAYTPATTTTAGSSGGSSGPSASPFTSAYNRRDPPASSPSKGGGSGKTVCFCIDPDEVSFCKWSASGSTECCTDDWFAKVLYAWNSIYMVLAWVMLFDHGWSTMSSCGPGFEERGFRFGLFSYYGPNQESSPEKYSDCHKYQTFGCKDIESGTLGVLVVMILVVLAVTLWWIGLTIQSCLHCGLVGYRTTVWLYLFSIIMSLCAPVIWLASAQPEVNWLRSFASCHKLFIGWPVWMNFGLLAIKLFFLPAFVINASDSYIFQPRKGGSLYW